MKPLVPSMLSYKSFVELLHVMKYVLTFREKIRSPWQEV